MSTPPDDPFPPTADGAPPETIRLRIALTEAVGAANYVHRQYLQWRRLAYWFATTTVVMATAVIYLLSTENCRP